MSAADNHDVLAEMRGAVKWVWFNRPQVKNALTPAVADQLRAEIAQAPGEGARVVVISGQGGAFCAGADLKAVAAMMGEDVSVRDILTNHYHPLVTTIAGLPLPVIAAVDGAAAGIGCDIALAADIRLASARAFFAQNFVNINLMPDGGGSFHLSRLVGLGRALEMAMTGRRVSAEEAERWGLVNHVYATESFEADVAAYATQLAQQAPLAVARAKQAIRRHAAGVTLDEALAHEATGQQALCETEDFAEGVMAFLSKRPPNFQGR